MRTCTIDDLADWIKQSKLESDIGQHDKDKEKVDQHGHAVTPTLLIIDFRNTFEFEASYVPRYSVHLIIPHMLFSRATYTAEKVEGSLGTRSLRYQHSFRHRHSARHIVFIDSEKPAIVPSKMAGLMYTKLVENDCDEDRLFWLKGIRTCDHVLCVHRTSLSFL